MIKGYILQVCGGDTIYDDSTFYVFPDYESCQKAFEKEIEKHIEEVMADNDMTKEEVEEEMQFGIANDPLDSAVDWGGSWAVYIYPLSEYRG